MTDDRRARLRGIKLQALVRDHLGRDLAPELGAFPPGAALVESGVAWVLLEDEPERGLGAALAWSHRRRGDALHVLADRSTGLLARRAGGFRVPITVWHVDGRALLPAVAEPPIVPPAPAPAHLALVDAIVAGGAVPVIEHGVVTGEVRGLEVCRVVDDVHTGAVRLEVGVGAHDREAFAIVHGDVPTVEALSGVVDAVTGQRGVDAQHPLNRLAPERLLRWRLEQQPAQLGPRRASQPAQPPVPRPNVKDRVPCTATGRRDDGSTVLLVCSVGVDLDLVPYAIDARLAALVDERNEPGVAGEVWLVAAASRPRAGDGRARRRWRISRCRWCRSPADRRTRSPRSPGRASWRSRCGEARRRRPHRR